MNKIYRKFFLSEDRVFFDIGIIKKHESQEKLSIDVFLEGTFSSLNSVRCIKTQLRHNQNSKHNGRQLLDALSDCGSSFDLCFIWRCIRTLSKICEVFCKIVYATSR